MSRRPIHRRALISGAAALAAALGCAAQAPAPAIVHVLMSGGYLSAMSQVLPDLQRATNVAVTTATGASQGTGPNTIGAQLSRGMQADVVILSREGLDDLIKQGRIVPGSDVNLAYTPLGLAVRAGSPKPDIHDMAAYKRTLMAAKSIVIPGSTSGIWLANTLLPKLGIPKDKYHSVDRGVQATEDLAAGKVDIAVLPISEILHIEGVELAGPVPQEAQFDTSFCAAVVKNATDIAAAKRVIAYLNSDKVAKALEYAGMKPGLAPKH